MTADLTIIVRPDFHQQNQAHYRPPHETTVAPIISDVERKIKRQQPSPRDEKTPNILLRIQTGVILISERQNK